VLKCFAGETAALAVAAVTYPSGCARQQQQKQQFPQQNILTPDDGRIGRNML
jgi:hypothetical protein